MNLFRCKITKKITLVDWFQSMFISKNKINYLIDNGFCFINDQVLKRESILNVDDYLLIDLSNFHKQTLQKTDQFVEVLYEDDYIIVVNKPAKYIIYSDDDKLTVTDMVNSYLFNKNEICFPCHRLDVDTTGCLVYAKDIITLAYLSHIFESKDVIKEYLAIVEGHTKLNGIINLPIGTDRHVNNKMVISKNGKPALTKYCACKILNNKTLIKVNLISGRTHQIRVHMAYIGHPLIGDDKYGSKIKANRTMLHCHNIVFNHPFMKKRINIESNMPVDMKKFVK